MSTVFVAGSIAIKKLDPVAQVRLVNIIELGHHVLVGDADGADTAIQQFLHESGARNVTVYCVGGRPRNNLGDWPINSVATYHKPGSRAYFTAKDIEMAKDADVGLMIWDAKSTGTLSNVIELLTRKRNSTVFINKDKAFHKVVKVADLESLVAHMADASRLKADTKIGLLDKIATLRSRELQSRILLCKEEAAALANQATATSAKQSVDSAIEPAAT
ncbi:hypothetical protein [Massilia glaciei]|uniref:Uncharacterized protein n=1 Tax=Massilia glaciei TaxID=1524097 RepID=A0A2U2HK66_9BURK|nr:hypothetical protein [Massilia glaciei]PWF47835.1 hypothetical protein C7C56_013660 [Massilia glaciei]